MIRPDCHIVFDFTHRHLGRTGEQTRQLAWLIGNEMLYKDEPHAGILRQMTQQLRKLFQAARRSPDTDNGKSNLRDVLRIGWRSGKGF
jgi:hypothetical protein